MESYKDYPHHHGDAHTPLLRPATITENGVELGWVIGLPITGEYLGVRVYDTEYDDTHTHQRLDQKIYLETEVWGQCTHHPLDHNLSREYL